jgi:hypothetical protein
MYNNTIKVMTMSPIEYILLGSLIISLFLVVYTVIKGKRWRFIAASIFMFCISSVFLLSIMTKMVPEIKFYGLELKISQPTRIGGFFGKESKVDAKNTNSEQPIQLFVTATSTSSAEPRVNFVLGQEYITKIEKAPDGNLIVYQVQLPPSAVLHATSPSVVSVIPWSSSKDDN